MGLAVPIDDPVPTLATVYCVQAFWHDRRKLCAGRIKQFRHEADARTTALAWSCREVGVIAFAVTGNPEVDYWEEPRLLVAYGDVPPLAG